MANYDIRCRIIEEELNTFWPEWHVVERIGRGAFGDVFRIRRNNYGTGEEAALKIIRINDEMELSDIQASKQENAPGEARSDGSVETETQVLLSAPQKDQAAEPEAADTGNRPAEAKQGKHGRVRKDVESPYIPEALSNEIQIMRALRGAPNIVVIEDFHFKREGAVSTLFVRMELLTSFQERLLKNQNDRIPFSAEEVYKIGIDICTALMYCEKKGIIHRDIKPANIFMDGFGNYKIGDFGASSRMDTVYSAHTMTAIGTVSYMAPEVFKGKSYNNTVDIYALGLILYQILNNGRIAFLSMSGSYGARDIDNANYRRLCGEPLPSLTGIPVSSGDEKRTVDAYLDAIIRKACAPNARDRFRTAEEFRDALREWKNASAQGSFNRQQSAVRSADKKSVPNQALSIGREKNGEYYPGNGKTEKQKSRFRVNVLGGAVILFLVAVTAFLGVLIFNGVRNSGAEHIEQSGGEGLDGSVGSTSDPAGEAYAESSPDMTESEIPASYDETEEKNEIRGTITDSWEVIMAAIKDYTYLDKYHIGDTKELDLGEEGVILMELVAVDEYDWAGDPVCTTWVAKDPLKSRHKMNSDATSEGGWEESEMRTWLQESILPLFPVELQFNILETERYTEYHYKSPTEEKNGVAIADDKIWIPSRQELFHSDENDLRSLDFGSCFPDEASCIRKSRDDNKPLWWWLRSSQNDTDFDRIGINGRSESGNADKEGGVIIGFCL